MPRAIVIWYGEEDCPIDGKIVKDDMVFPPRAKRGGKRHKRKLTTIRERWYAVTYKDANTLLRSLVGKEVRILFSALECPRSKGKASYGYTCSGHEYFNMGGIGRLPYKDMPADIAAYLDGEERAFLLTGEHKTALPVGTRLGTLAHCKVSKEGKRRVKQEYANLAGELAGQVYNTVLAGKRDCTDISDVFSVARTRAAKRLDTECNWEDGTSLTGRKVSKRTDTVIIPELAKPTKEQLLARQHREGIAMLSLPSIIRELLSLPQWEMGGGI